MNKRIEATKLHERTGAPMAGPEVTIPFGALVESAPASAPAVAPAEVGLEAPARPAAKEARLKFERLDAGGYSAARAKVPGGWLVACGAGVTFYPDPRHEWDGASVE